MILEDIKEDLNKAIDLQEELGNPFVTIHKPRSKEKVVIFDSDTAAIDVIDNDLSVDFWELGGFNIGLNKIKSVITKTIDDMTIVYLKLKYGNTIMLHFFK